MKNILMLLILSCSLKTLSQDSMRIKQIDSLTRYINRADFKIQTDSTIKDLSQVGLYMKTFLTIVTDGNRLKKYINKVNSVIKRDGVSKEVITSSSFYFDKDRLIKVEEYIIEDGETNNADWYFADDKPLYYTVKNDRSEERAKLLLEMSKDMIKLINR